MFKERYPTNEDQHFINCGLEAMKDKNSRQLFSIWLESNPEVQKNIASKMYEIKDYEFGNNIIDKFTSFYQNKNNKTDSLKNYIIAFREIGARNEKLKQLSAEWLIKESELNKKTELSYSFANALKTKAMSYLLEETDKIDKNQLENIFNSLMKSIIQITKLDEKEDILYNISVFKKDKILEKRLKKYLLTEWKNYQAGQPLHNLIADELIELSDIDPSVRKRLAIIIKQRFYQNPNDRISFKLLREAGKVGDTSFIPLIDELSQKYPYPGVKQLAKTAKEEIIGRKDENQNV